MTLTDDKREEILRDDLLICRLSNTYKKTTGRQWFRFDFVARTGIEPVFPP
jgi:hypothetical protein